MDFEEVKLVWNKVIPSIKEVINVTELVDYVADLFSPISIQKIKAQDKQYGLSTASSEFFEEAKRKPNSFPVILAALKKTQQTDCLIKILQTIVNVIKSLERREEVFNLVKKGGETFDRPVSLDEEIRLVTRPSLPIDNGAPGATGVCKAGARDDSQAITSRPDRAQTSVLEVVSPACEEIMSSIQPASSDSNLPEIVPSVQMLPEQSEVIYQRQQNSPREEAPTIDSAPDVTLGKLKSSARKKISEELEALSSDGKTPVWQQLLDSEDLDIDSNETRQIEKSRSPGKDFYDKLVDLGFTTRGLIDMLYRDKCHDAVNTVRQQSTQVAKAPFKKDLTQFDENNLNLAKQRTALDQQSQLNIPAQTQAQRTAHDQQSQLNIPAQTQGRRTALDQQSELNIPAQTQGQQSQLSSSDCQRLTVQGVTGSYDETTTTTGEERQQTLEDKAQNVPGEIHDIATTQVTSHEGKDTQAIEAVGDRDNLKSTLTPEGERQKLIQDRVKQHTGSEDNLQSFADLRKTSEQNKDIPAEHGASSHDFSSVNRLNQPELYHQQQLGTSNNPTGSQSHIESTGSRTDTEKKTIQLEHVDGPTFYETQLDSLQKLHADDDTETSDLCSSLASVTLSESELQNPESAGSSIEAEQTTNSDGNNNFSDIQQLTKHRE